MPTPNDKDDQQDLLRRCLQQIEQKLGWGTVDQWRHRHFELLSDKIWAATNVRLSAVTLKRLWGRITYKSSPATNTLDALVQFLGYDDWITYSQVHANQMEASAANNKSLFPRLLAWVKGNRIFLVAGIVLIAILGLFALTKSAKKPPTTTALAFDFQPITTGLPNTVTFTYHTKHTNADSVFIQQSWDPRLRHQVDKMDSFHATTYYYPGSFQAKLILDETIVAEKGLVIKSNGWLGTIEQETVPYYIHYPQLHQDNVIAIKPEDLTQQGLALTGEIPYTNLHLVEDFGEVGIDNFHLTTVFKNTLGHGASICQLTDILILCEDTPLIIPFSIKGCVGELGLNLPDKNIDGQQHDLSGFGVDFSDWVRLDVITNNNLLEIQVDQQPVFQDTIRRDPGNIVGIRYRFHGTGAVKHFELRSRGEVKYASSF